MSEEAEPGGGGAGNQGLILVSVQTKADRRPASSSKYMWGCCFLNSSLFLTCLSVSSKRPGSEQHPPHRDPRPQDLYFCGSPISYSLHIADERTKNLALEAISLSPIHILWSNVSHKKNLVT